MADSDFDVLMREARRLSEAAAQTARGGRVQQEIRRSPHASRIPSGSQAVGDVRAAQELLLGGRATAPSPVSYALGAIPTALRVNQNPNDRLDILREFANNPRSSTYQRAASEAGAGPRTAAVAGTAAEFLEPGPDIGPLINSVPFIPGLLRRIANTGRRGERAALRIARSADITGGGPVRAGMSRPISEYYTTHIPTQADYARLQMYADQAMGLARTTGRTIQGELLLDPDRILDVTDEALFDGTDVGTANTGARRFIQWARGLPENPALPRSSINKSGRRLMSETAETAADERTLAMFDERKRRRLRSLITEWDRGSRDTADFVRELRKELGRERFDTAMRSLGFDALIQFPEENLERVGNAAEVVVFNPRSVRPMNVNPVDEFEQAASNQMRNRTTEGDINDLMKLYWPE